jgi:hypothetical protein
LIDSYRIPYLRSRAYTFPSPREILLWEEGEAIRNGYLSALASRYA